MEEFQPNSHRFKDQQQKNDVPEKKVEKVVTGPVISRKRNIFQEIAKEFLMKDVRDIKSYILQDIVIPTVKKAVDDTVHMILYGDTGSKKSNSLASSVSYRSYYDKQREQNEPARRSPGNRATDGWRYNFDKFQSVGFSSRGDAERVLMQMDELIDIYGSANIGDFYDLVGMTGDYTDNRYGWTDLQSAVPVRERDGSYSIQFPTVTLLK